MANNKILSWVERYTEYQEGERYLNAEELEQSIKDICYEIEYYPNGFIVKEVLNILETYGEDEEGKRLLLELKELLDR
jgi:hypothetical protein